MPDLPSRSDSLASNVEFERALADLGHHLDYPPTPDLSGSVRARLTAGPSPHPRRALFTVTRRSLAWAALALVLLAGGLLVLSPEARRVVAERLGLPGVTITHIPTDPAVTITPGAPLTLAPNRSPAGDGLGLGVRVATLAEAQTQVTFPLLTPTLPELGAPDALYLAARPPGGHLALVYLGRPGVPATPQTGVGLLFTQSRGSLEPAVFRKGLGPGSRMEELTLNGRPAVWIEGQPHMFIYRDQSGRQGDETFRLAANVLLWQQDGLTLRIEGAFPKEQALRIAASVR